MKSSRKYIKTRVNKRLRNESQLKGRRKSQEQKDENEEGEGRREGGSVWAIK